jgi:hypothetical protein
MNDTVLIRPELAAPAASPLEALARRAVLRRLEGLGQGTLLIQEGGRLHRFGAGLPEARVSVMNPDFWPRVAFGGSVGAGESYMAGDWHSDDLTGLLRLLLRNRAVVDGMETGWRDCRRRCVGLPTAATATPAPAAGATSPPTTTWATTSTGSGWTRP